MKRVAADGRAYTLEEFKAFYGTRWSERWRAAGAVPPGEAAGAFQPGEAAGAGQPGDAAGVAQHGSDARSVASVTSAVVVEAAGVVQPGEAAGAGQLGDAAEEFVEAVAAVLVQESTDAFSGAGQAGANASSGGGGPGGDAPAGAAAFGLWREAPFFTTTLPSQGLPARFPMAGNPRDAIDVACGALYEYLPLLCSRFCNFDLATELGEDGALVVAEKVARIPDGNRAPQVRVDFFCYHDSGDVVRHHPGRTKAQSGQPHRMSPRSVLFRKATAWRLGVGAALHAEPPGVLRDAHHERGTDADAGQLGAAADTARALEFGALLATRQDMDEIYKFDVNMLNWKVAREKLAGPPDDDRTVDWSDGVSFPWWVWLANTGQYRDVVNEGVRAVGVEVKDEVKSIVVHSVREKFWLYAHPNTGKMQVWPVPRKVD